MRQNPQKDQYFIIKVNFNTVNSTEIKIVLKLWLKRGILVWWGGNAHIPINGKLPFTVNSTDSLLQLCTDLCGSTPCVQGASTSGLIMHCTLTFTPT